jgi:hypothetical protein
MTYKNKSFALLDVEVMQHTKKELFEVTLSDIDNGWKYSVTMLVKCPVNAASELRAIANWLETL